MRALCVGHLGKDLPSRVLELTKNLTTSVFDVSVGREYVVYAICMWATGTLHYLVIADLTGRPSWYPADIFRIVDNSVPQSWRFDYVGYASDGTPQPVLATWGYPEMVEDRTHHDALQNRDAEALRVFEMRRLETESAGAVG